MGKNLRCEGHSWNIYFGTQLVDKKSVRFYGPDALLCKTPKHPPGKVPVVIQTSKDMMSNDKEFIFLEINPKSEPVQPILLDNFFPEFVQDIPGDQPNPFFLHQICGEGKFVDWTQISEHELNKQDETGSPPIYWAIWAGFFLFSILFFLKNFNSNPTSN